MSKLRPELRALVEALIKASAQTREVSLDALGEAIGSRVISYDEIDAMIGALEARDRRVDAATDGRTVVRLHTVVATARLLDNELGRRPSVEQIAARSGLSVADVRAALMLARVMQR